MHLELSQFSRAALLNKIMYCLFSMFVSLQLQDSEHCFGIHWNLTIISDSGETQTSSNHPSSQCYHTVTPSCKNQDFSTQISKEFIYILLLIFKTERTVLSFIPWGDSSPPKLNHAPHVDLYIFQSFLFNSKNVFAPDEAPGKCFLCVLGVPVENKTRGVSVSAMWGCGHRVLGRSRKEMTPRLPL